MSKEVKIIWHFKTESLTPEQMDKAEIKIKEFHNNSLICFDKDLEIIILNDE